MTTSPRVDYGGGAGAYRNARTPPPEVLDRWRVAVESLDISAPSLIDLGAGPGGFLAPVSSWLQARRVVAVEPSESMRAEAATAGATTRFPYVAGVAEALPLATGSFDAAWVSAAVHQFDDLGSAAAELRRVVRDGGHVLVRGFFADVPVSGAFAAFPGIARSAAGFPSTATVVAAFEGAGFIGRGTVDVVEPWRFELASWEQRLGSVRATDSLLRALTDEEVDAGRRAVIAGASPDGTVHSDVTLRLVALVAADGTGLAVGHGRIGRPRAGAARPRHVAPRWA